MALSGRDLSPWRVDAALRRLPTLMDDDGEAMMINAAVDSRACDTDGQPCQLAPTRL
jgi:hypothetical protein